jgi:NAD(P)-dependent dehydrogenase (short-subunit alcohol dehydrogenase family)
MPEDIGRTLVVGATSGIGRALVTELGARGVPVVGAGRRIEHLAGVPGVVGFACDATSHDDVQRLVARAVEALGGLDAVVYAAGVSRIMPVGETPLDDWRSIYAANLFGAVDVVQECLPHLSTAGSQGRVVLMTSDSAELPYPGMVPYGTSKAALASFALGLRHERPDLRVTDLVVGPTDDTGMAEQIGHDNIGEWFGRWAEGGFLRYEVQLPKDVVAAAIDLLTADEPPARLVPLTPAAS